MASAREQMAAKPTTTTPKQYTAAELAAQAEAKDLAQYMSNNAREVMSGDAYKNAKATQSVVNEIKAATADTKTAKDAADAAAAERKRIADLEIFNNSILGAQKTVREGNKPILDQISQQDSKIEQKDISYTAGAPIPAGVSPTFDIGEAQKASIAKTGATSSGGGKGSPKSAYAQQTAEPSSMTGAEKNKFSAPDMQGIKFGGA